MMRERERGRETKIEKMSVREKERNNLKKKG
jgi:hypothetical protein